MRKCGRWSVTSSGWKGCTPSEAEAGWDFAARRRRPHRGGVATCSDRRFGPLSGNAVYLPLSERFVSANFTCIKKAPRCVFRKADVKRRGEVCGADSYPGVGEFRSEEHT